MPVHVVCHDCEAENVLGDETTAEVLVDGHRRRHGHHVETREVDDV
jgi:hypothetical protein